MHLGVQPCTSDGDCASGYRCRKVEERICENEKLGAACQSDRDCSGLSCLATGVSTASEGSGKKCQDGGRILAH